MTRCPTCRAAIGSRKVCYRCGTRFDDVIAIESEADACQQAARRALARRELASAQGHADRALFLHRSEAALQAAALVALARRDFPAACTLWREWREAAERS